MKPEKPSILVVEDEPKMRRLLELQLAEEGFVARTAGDAETGLQILGKHFDEATILRLAHRYEQARMA